MAWSDLVTRLDASCLSILGGVQATFTPQGGSPQTIHGLIKPPAMEEDFAPGGSPGTKVLRFFVQYSRITPAPARGDLLVVSGTTYVLIDPCVDDMGSATLKLRSK